jgi:UDP-N-acetylmuramoyl-L-alanyl-D-glutamate--2,6-diaminopimelate ligase
VAATLGQIADILGAPIDGADRSLVVTDVTHDSRAVVEGSLFVAITGARHDGHAFVGAAVSAGATAILAEHPIDPQEVGATVPVLVVPGTRPAMALAAREAHGRPDEGLSIIGVTGTNGKTTVTHMCEAVWELVGRPHGIVGTLGSRYAGTPVPLSRTTPESSDLQRLLGVMRDSGIESVAMEVSSHALALHRADAVHFRAVGFTNLTQDHLDFHGTMGAYLRAKKELFADGRADTAVVNVSNAAGRDVAQTTALRVLTVGWADDLDVFASGMALTRTGSTFTITHRTEAASVSLPLLGAFNVENALVAVGLLLCDGVDLEDAAAGLAHMRPIPGRMEVVGHERDVTVVVDYAHTPDAIESVLGTVREMAFARTIVVLGAGGDRDRGKRAAMGSAAARGADITFVTTDNPRSEDPVAIARVVQEGALSARSSDVRVVIDRREAIDAAIGTASAGDVVLILGRGHEPDQEVAGTMHPFDDRAVAMAVLADMGSRA